MDSVFRREDVLKAFFNIEDSHIRFPSTNNKNLKAGSINSQSVNTKHQVTKQKLTLLTLPAEIRLQIYDILLVSRFDREQNPSWAVGKTYQKLISLHMIRAPQYRTMEPAILQTCKQIYHEAISILYSRNVFAISAPEQMFQFIAQTALANVESVRSLQIWVPWRCELLPWIGLLTTLSERATGLKSMELAWDAECESLWPIGSPERGLGENVLFVRALARIKQLDELRIKGFYAKNWPSYLRGEMSAQLHVECGHPVELQDEDDENDEETVEWARGLNENNLKRFRAYQEGTETVIP